jgi:Pin2-interacting protein X1
MAYAADLCGSKLKAKLASTMNEKSAAPISSTSFAAKQMAKMGWKEGTGLGKKRDGIVTHIKVQKREDLMGLGVEKERTRKLGTEGMWWSSNVSETLMKLQANKSDKKKSKKSKKDKKDKSKKKSKKKSKEVSMKVYTDEELFEATGGARFGMRAQRRAEGKWQRTESSQHLKEWEEEAKKKIEWNGLGKAKVLLESRDSSNSADSEDGRPGNKRKRRDDESPEEEKKEDDVPVEPSSTEESSSIREANEKKRRKKSKSEKKSKKKSKEKSS